MATVRASILINHPIGKIFEYVVLPQNHIKFFPYLKETSQISPILPSLGQTYSWRYFMGGIQMKGNAIVSQYIPPQKFAMTTTGDVVSTWTFLFEDGVEGTKVTLTVDYEFEQNIVKRIMNQLILAKLNEKTVQDLLENLKAQLEA